MNGKFLVTGGAGFVGSNLANNLLSGSSSVTILDSLSRKGTQNNLAWLRSQHGNGQLEYIQADVRDFAAVQGCKSFPHQSFTQCLCLSNSLFRQRTVQMPLPYKLEIPLCLAVSNDDELSSLNEV